LGTKSVSLCASAHGDGGCWNAADEWYATFGSGDSTYEEWLATFADHSAITESVLRNGLFRYWAPLYRQWGVHHVRYNPAPQWHDAPPPPDYVAEMDRLYRDILSACAKAVHGTCGVSYGITGIAPGAAGRFSGDFYVDTAEDIALYGSVGAGPAVMLFPQPMRSHGVSFVAIPNATVNEVGGFSLQIGGSVAAVQGPAVDLIVAVSEYAPTGVSVGSAYGSWNAEGHIIVSYSVPLFISRD
jgi:hypothetical protein